jgi:ribosomal protein S18 acetylase RimI-like enzyme
MPRMAKAKRAVKKPATPARKKRTPAAKARGKKREADPEVPVISVRRIHRRDLNRVWEFLKLSFAQVNLETVEYQRPRSKKRFIRTYDEEGIDQLVFEVGDDIVAYAECAHEVVGSDNWMNENYFERRKMEPLFVEELAVHPNWNGRGVGSFVMQQLEHLAKVRGLSHLVLEVAENNEHALQWYRKRGFRKLDSAIFMSLAVDTEPELLPPKPVKPPAPGVAHDRDGKVTDEPMADVLETDPDQN